MSLRIIQGSAIEAERFLNSNSRGSAFLSPKVHQKLGIEIEWWFVLKGAEKYLLLPVLSDEKFRAIIPPFFYYFGPCWADVFLDRPISSRFSDSQKIYRLLLEHMFAKYTEFTFELDPQEVDVRSFLWWNDEAGNPKVQVTPRYSARITGLNTDSAIEIRSRFRTLRRREVNRAEKANQFEFRDLSDWTSVENGYVQVIRRNEGELNPKILSAVRSFQLLEDSDNAFSIGAFERKTGKLASFIFVLRGYGVANLLISFTNPEFRDSGVGPLTTLQAIIRSKELGDSVFDFNGANSPNRGDDKHSYGARPVLYFRVSTRK